MHIKVFIVDDSVVSRMVLRRLVEQDSHFEVVGEASNGKQAIQQIPNLNVDIVLMDLMMPVMDGFDATRWLMEHAPLPILLISDLVGRDAALNFRAVNAGALDVIRKPSAEELADPATVTRLHRLIRILADVPVVTRRHRVRRPDFEHGVGLEENTEQRLELFPPAVSLVVIGASTGGPLALARLLGGLGAPPPWPVIIVQHITRDFAPGMARWLGEISGLDVELVSKRTPLCNGKIFVAPDSGDLVVNGRYLEITEEENEPRSYPCIDVTFESVAAGIFAPESLGILLTGMGSDGARALRKLREAGGWTIAQDQDSSTIWGIPRAAIEIGAAREVLSLDKIGERLKEIKGTGPLG